LCGTDTTFGAEWSYTLLDSTQVALGLSCLRAGRLAEAHECLQEAVRGFEQRPQAEWHAWALSAVADLADATGDPALVKAAPEAAAKAQRLARDSGNLSTAIRSGNAIGIAALLQGHPHEAIAAVEQALREVRRRGGSHDEADLHVTLARAHLALGDARAARAAADEALRVAQATDAPVAKSWAYFARALALRTTATNGDDLAAAREAVDAGQATARSVGALTYLAFLAEERARLDGDALALKSCIDGYTAIGADGHAERIRLELHC
jgi:tetratricopeptide (TPR) repeat protein